MLSLSEKEQVLCVINKAARISQLLRATLRMCLSPVKRIKRSHSCRLRSYHASAADIIAIAPKSSGKMEKAPCRGGVLSAVSAVQCSCSTWVPWGIASKVLLGSSPSCFCLQPHPRLCGKTRKWDGWVESY